MRASKAFYLLFSEYHNTSTAAEKCFLDILGVFADFETNLRRPQSLCWQGPSGLSPRPYSRGGYCISRGIAMPNQSSRTGLFAALRLPVGQRHLDQHGTTARGESVFSCRLLEEENE
jgi:hypothetical protein